MGSHNLQFGAYFVAAQKNELGAPGVANGYLNFDTRQHQFSTGNAFADLLMGKIASASARASAQPKFYNRYKIFEPYFQDDWHVPRQLTLNLGLRISMFGTYRERYHNEYNFDTHAYVPAADEQRGSGINRVWSSAIRSTAWCNAG